MEIFIHQISFWILQYQVENIILLHSQLSKKHFEYFQDISDIKFSINIALSDITNEETMQIFI